MGWLEDFVEHTKYGETPPKVMYWVGVSTIAGALRRKVWIDEFTFQWTPNFYMLLVGPPGRLKKSTSIDLGSRLLARIEGIDFGPDAITWEQLITHMADSRQTYKVNERDFEASCVTVNLSEFGTLFDPGNRPMVDALTELFDAKLKTFRKETKTNGHDEVVNPFLNMFACTTEGWLEDNFSTKYIRSGFSSRVIFIHCDETGRAAHPARKMAKMLGLSILDAKAKLAEEETGLVERLEEIAEYSGEYKLTEEAYEWSEKWYEEFRDFLEQKCNEDEMSLYSRKQSNLMKLAMVISASKGKFPEIDVDELREAAEKLDSVNEDVMRVFGNVGQSPVSKLAKDIVGILKREGEQKKRVLYRKHFFRTVGVSQFGEAVDSVKASGLVIEVGNLNDSILKVA